MSRTQFVTGVYSSQVACLMPVSPFIAKVSGLPLAISLTVCAVFAALAWLINISAIVVDVVPKHSVGTVFSVVAAGSTLGGIAMNMVVAATANDRAVLRISIKAIQVTFATRATSHSSDNSVMSRRFAALSQFRAIIGGCRPV